MFGTALSTSATRVLLLGSGELGKEVAIECQRLLIFLQRTLDIANLRMNIAGHH